MSYAIREWQNKAMRFHYTPTPQNAGKDAEEQKLPFIASGNAQWCRHFGTYLRSLMVLPFDPAMMFLNIYSS
jgi:hypothetical protein